MALELKARLQSQRFFQDLPAAQRDEVLYQEARRIVIAEVIFPPFFCEIFSKLFFQFQNIAYSEYLPTIIGPKMMQEYNLQIGSGPTKYDPEADPRVSNEFATVSFCCMASFVDAIPSVSE